MNKKAQTTYYIIIGVVLLFMVVIMSYLLFFREVEVYVPQEIKPVYDHVISCMNDVGKNGIHKLGLQGGYINVPQIIKKTPRSYINLDNLGSVVIPFWYFEGEDRSSSVEFMERELAVLLKQELASCVDFDSLKPKFSVKIKDSLIPEVSINENDVKISVKWPLEISLGDQVKSHEDFVVKHSVRLKQAFDLSKKVMDYENNEKFFERLTIDLMSVDSEIPMDGMEFSCDVRKWHLSNVRSRLQDTLKYNIPHVRIINTDYVPFESSVRDYKSLSDKSEAIYDELRNDVDFSNVKVPSNIPSDAFEYSSMALDVKQAPTSLKAGFFYSQNFGMELNAQPNEGGRLTSNKAKGVRKYMNVLCVNQWHFVYDVIYPLVMSVSDDEAFNGEGFLFQMAFPVLINDNAGERKYFGLRRFQPYVEDAEYCNRKGNVFVDIKALGLEDGSPFALPLENASVGFQCGGEECSLGATKSERGSYGLFTNLPQGCGNPIIKVSKQGYLPAQQYLLSGQNELEINLPKLQRMNIDFMKKVFDVDNDVLHDAEDLDKSYKVRGNIYLRSHDFSQYFTYPSNDTVDLLYDDGSYDVNILVVDKNGVLIGGYTAENLDIKFNDVDGKNIVVFNVLEQAPIPASEKERAEMIGLIADQRFSSDLRPEFK